MKQIVERMGGEVGVTSTEGQGSIFFCKIPLKRAAEAGMRALLDSSSLAGLSVLVSGGHQVARCRFGMVPALGNECSTV